MCLSAIPLSPYAIRWYLQSLPSTINIAATTFKIYAVAAASVSSITTTPRLSAAHINSDSSGPNQSDIKV
ncbi:hypothetical protein CHS0354_038475 [Potamilus streckersoni]|uniref:Uncharacterized protein n=1 Tax=Potamilus streckersoni TaxID=2493646 RepID=A0AAE0S678_9BIVA|nr:hypothetical protein CHS0354_038475 [Potamilus streckersoni]